MKCGHTQSFCFFQIFLRNSFPMPMPVSIANCCFRIGSCPALRLSHATSDLVLTNFKKLIELGTWTGWEA